MNLLKLVALIMCKHLIVDCITFFIGKINPLKLVSLLYVNRVAEIKLKQHLKSSQKAELFNINGTYTFS